MINLDEIMTRGQIAFALAVIALSLAYMAFSKHIVFVGKKQTSSKKSK